MLYNFSITGWGYYLPKKKETANELAKKINKTSTWISTRSGVDERRISEIDVDKMGAIAAKNAIQEKPPPDLIINASGVPKQTIPDTSVFIQKDLGYLQKAELSLRIAIELIPDFANAHYNLGNLLRDHD